MKQLLYVLILLSSTAVADCKVVLPIGVSKYEGGCSNQLANGQGRAYLPSRIAADGYYLGDFQNGKLHGKAIYYWAQDQMWSTEYFINGENADFDTFWGEAAPTESNRALKDQIAKRAEQSKKFAEEARRDEINKEERRKADIPKMLRQMNPSEFCVSFGSTMRGQSFNNVDDQKLVKSLFVAEAKRRKLSFKMPLIKALRVKIGMSECDLYASWGYPESSNRSVGIWGVHTQHVYDGAYVYTENGRVSSVANRK